MQLGGLERIQQGYREIVQEFCKLLQEHFGRRLKSICVFGSVARGEAERSGDVDFLVVIEGLQSDVLQRHREATPLILKLRKSESYRDISRGGRCVSISAIYLTPEELKDHPPILLDLVEDGVTLVDEDSLLSNELAHLKRKLEELGASRVVTPRGTRYWILKPGLKPGEVVEL